MREVNKISEMDADTPKWVAALRHKAHKAVLSAKAAIGTRDRAKHVRRYNRLNVLLRRRTARQEGVVGTVGMRPVTAEEFLRLL